MFCKGIHFYSIKSIKMKTLIISTIFISSFSLSAKADYNKVNNNLTVIDDTAKQSSLLQLLPLYYDIENALVNSEAGTAATKAAEFVKTIKSIDMKPLSEHDMNAFMSLEDKLASDAKHISKSKKISRQRKHFSSFSVNFYKLAKIVKLTDHIIYYDYCPMKKTYWLSSEVPIKNPYFGNQMLTCGKIVERIKPRGRK